MCPAIDNFTSCEIRIDIRFLHAEIMGAAEIHRELRLAVYGQSVLSEETVRLWCRMLKHGRTNVHDEERSGWLSVVRDDLVQSVEQRIYEIRRFTISKLSCDFRKLHALFSTRLSQLG
jgi:hypothetical protein